MDLRGSGPVGEENHSQQLQTYKALGFITGNIDVALVGGSLLPPTAVVSGSLSPVFLAPNPVPHPASHAQTNHWHALISLVGIMEGSQAWLETICTKVHVQARQGGEGEWGQCPREETGRRKEAKRSAG